MIRRAVRPLGMTLLALAAVAAAVTCRTASARSARVWFPRNRLPLANTTRLDAASPSQRMEIGIGFKDPHAAAEQALMAAQQDPASAQYRHFLTPAQYEARFAVPQTTFTKALDWLRAGGARVLHSSGARNFVEISATVTQIDKLFQTSIGRYSAKGTTFLANASAPSVPAGLHVLTVMGLNTLIHPTTPLTGATPAAPAGTTDSVLGTSTSPTALKSIPGKSSLLSSLGGALIDPDAESDFATWVDDPHGPKQANASFGECETTPANATLESTIPAQFDNNQDQNALYGTGAPNALEPVADQTLRQGVLEGRTLFASTGDTGSSCPVLVLGPELGAGNGVLNQGVPIANYPAVSPYVVAVGGSVLYPDDSTPAQRGLEYPWPYSGGGQSFFVGEPAFQKGQANVNRPCLSDLSGTPNTNLGTCRGVPDVTAMSGDIATSSYDIYSDELGGASGEGGTSLSSPLMVGMWARVQAASRGGTGFADPAIYAAGDNVTPYARDFYDYQLGTNGAYQATPGWDYVSGFGTPVLTPLIKDIDHGNTAPIQGR